MAKRPFSRLNEVFSVFLSGLRNDFFPVFATGDEMSPKWPEVTHFSRDTNGHRLCVMKNGEGEQG